MDTNGKLNEAEQQRRFEVVALLLPHFGKDTDQLLEAAISVQEHISGRPRLKHEDTERKE